jgi:CubicO group peptidase (beta-lactamase class C family)
VDAYLQQQVDSDRIAGAVRLVLRDGKVVYERALGWADRESGRRMSTDAMFRIASQTKALTSIAIMILLEEGKVALGNPVSRFIPAYASGVSLDEFIRTRITGPLRMNDTYFFVPPAQRDRLVAVYASDTGNRITVALMTTNQTGALFSANGEGFGLGFYILERLGADNGLSSVGSFGWGGAYGSQYMVDPKQGVVLVFMLNQLPDRSDVGPKFPTLVYQALTNIRE